MSPNRLSNLTIVVVEDHDEARRYLGIQAIKALMHAGELPVQDIADRFGVSRSTLYRNAAMPESPKALKIQTRAIHNDSFSLNKIVNFVP
jgi:predicted DNA-binding transcriptional regulator AlpA